MNDDQQFCLRWNSQQSALLCVFETLLENGTLVDCTLAAEGKFLKAHKVILSACSPYFASLLSRHEKHPIFILKNVKFQELCAIMDFMYRGEVNIAENQLTAFLKAAESLQIKGLCRNRGPSSSVPSQLKQQQQSELVEHRSQQQSQQQQAQHTDDEAGSGTDQDDAICVLDSDNDTDELQNERQAQRSVSIDSQGDKPINQSELISEPKIEYDDGQDENGNDLDQAGSIHDGEGSFKGYALWPTERKQSEAFMAAQDAVGGQLLDAQNHLRHSLFHTNFANSGQQRFQCNVCDKSYLRKRHLQRHVKNECIGIPPRFSCDHCDSKFRRKYLLEKHRASAHGMHG